MGRGFRRNGLGSWYGRRTEREAPAWRLLPFQPSSARSSYQNASEISAISRMAAITTITHVPGETRRLVSDAA